MKRGRHFFPAGNSESNSTLYAEVTLTGSMQPWVGKREAQRQAKKDGYRAVFHKTEDEARKALGVRDYRYLLLICDKLVIIKVPLTGLKWRAMLTALTPVMRSYGLRQKDIFSIERADNIEKHSLQLDKAFSGEGESYPEFDLWAWENGAFVWVRKGTQK